MAFPGSASMENFFTKLDARGSRLWQWVLLPFCMQGTLGATATPSPHNSTSLLALGRKALHHRWYSHTAHPGVTPSVFLKLKLDFDRVFVRYLFDRGPMASRST